METPSKHNASGSDRPLRLCKRLDLVAQPQRYQGRSYWIIKDPLSQNYFRFEEEEYQLLDWLDGKISLAELQRRFEEHFAPQKISLREIHQLLAMLHRNSLVVSDRPGQGQVLLQRNRDRLRKERMGAFANLLCVRFKGFDPDRLLDRLSRYAGWLFSRTCCLFVLALAIGAVSLIAVQFDTFQGKLPGFHEFFASGNWLWLAATLAATKVLHEFGHGLACKRFGGECHEMGVLILVFTPCLYCNVSDSWMLPSKWQRAAIGAAGMYVEVCVATVATYLWWFSHAGFFNYMCLNTMFVCSVSTLLFNANPLMRYDGYYILSDLLEIPNLRQKATAILRRKLGWWLLGLPESADPFLPQRHHLLFSAYSISALIYRWLVVFGIFWFVYYLFEPYGFKVIGQLIVAISAYGLCIHPLIQFVNFFRVPGRYEQVSRVKCLVTVAGFALISGVVFGISTPHFVRCNVHLQARDAAAAYVESRGILADIHVRPGEWVTAGQPLVTLVDTDLELGVARLYGEQQKLESKLASLRQRAFADDSAAAEISEVRESLDGIAEQLQNRQLELEQLQIVAPRDGFVMPVASVRNETAPGELARWSGSPLDHRNLNALLEPGDLICRVGDPQRLQVVLAIDQGDIEFVLRQQPVEFVLDMMPDVRRETSLSRVARVDMQRAPRSLSAKAGGELATRTDGSGVERPLQTTYQASAPLEDPHHQLMLGATGRARILVGRQTIAERTWRFVCQTFSFDV